MKILTVLFVLKFIINLRVKTIPDLITHHKENLEKRDLKIRINLATWNVPSIAK